MVIKEVIENSFGDKFDKFYSDTGKKISCDGGKYLLEEAIEVYNSNKNYVEIDEEEEKEKENKEDTDDEDLT